MNRTELNFKEINMQHTQAKPQLSDSTLSNAQLTMITGGNLEAPFSDNYDAATLQYQPWRDDQHVNSLLSRRHTGYASKFNAMN
jgi:hypothetical protein